MRDEPVVRPGGPADFDAALAVWRGAVEARLGEPASPEHGDRTRAHIQKPDAFLFVAENSGEIVGMAVGMQGLGGRLVDAVLGEARTRGYARAQLWTHADNARAHRLYQSRDFRRTGRESHDDVGETIVHYDQDL